MYQGDYLAASTVVFNFNTASFSDGSPITLGGTPALSVYKNSTTESTTGITLTVDYDARTGMQHVVIDTSADGTFYAAGNDFDVIITTGTVGGTSVVGRKVGSFSLENRTQKADVRKILGTACTAATAGILDANAKNINNVSTSSVTTINANLGMTQPVNFTGTAASALVKGDAIDVGGTAQTGLDLGGTWTAARAAHLDADISSRMATFTLPTNFSALLVSAGGHISNVDTLTTYTGNTPQTGDAYARLGAPAGASIAADLAEIEAETDGIAAIPTNPLLASGVPANFASLGIGVSGHILTVDTCTTNTDMRGTDSAALAATALSTVQWTNARAVKLDDLDQAISTILTTAMTESYAAKGATMTAAQALYVLQAWLTNFAVASTTYTAKKLDGTTAAATGTLDSATTPTQNLRAT